MIIYINALERVCCLYNGVKTFALGQPRSLMYISDTAVTTRLSRARRIFYSGKSRETDRSGLAGKRKG